MASDTTVCASQLLAGLELVTRTPPPGPESLRGLEAVENYLSEHRSPQISWHIILNNHASTRPDKCGGKLCSSITKCKTFVETAPGGSWICRLDVPNSFAPGDGLRLRADVVARTRVEAGELACRRAMAQLLVQNPSKVLLRLKHWTVPPDELLVGMTEVLPALPLHVRVRAGKTGPESTSLAEEENDKGVANGLVIDLGAAAASGPANACADKGGRNRKRPAFAGGASSEGAASSFPNTSQDQNGGGGAASAASLPVSSAWTWREATLASSTCGGAASGCANAWIDEAGGHPKSGASGGGAFPGGSVPLQWLDGVPGVFPECQTPPVQVPGTPTLILPRLANFVNCPPELPCRPKHLGRHPPGKAFVIDLRETSSGGAGSGSASASQAQIGGGETASCACAVFGHAPISPEPLC